MLAILLGLFGSFTFAVSMILINRGIASLDYFRGLLTNLGFNSLFLWIYVLLFTQRIDLKSHRFEFLKMGGHDERLFSG